jgi:hypothetical protein
MISSAIPREALVPKWRPTIPVDVAAIAGRMRYYTNGRWRFVVFANGTCVLVSNISKDPAAEAKALVESAGFGHVDFDPRSMDDSNFLVGFTQKVCGIVLATEMIEHRPYIDAHFRDGVRSEEVLLPGGKEQTAPDDRFKAGLLARSRLFVDAEALEIVQICEPTA